MIAIGTYVGKINKNNDIPDGYFIVIDSNGRIVVDSEGRIVIAKR